MTLLDHAPPAEKDGSEFAHYSEFSVEYRDASHRYWIIRGADRAPAISVTSALKVLDKPALLDWAEGCGAKGAAQLAAQGELDGVDIADVPGLVRLHGLGKDAARDKGADRGTIVHQVLQSWATDGKTPKLGDFEAHIRGFVQGLSRWLLKAQPEPTAVETIVGHADHGYAGRMDLRARIDGTDTIVDLKTNPKGRVYPEAHLQAVGYDLAAQACGMPPAGRIVIVAAGEDGTFEEVDGLAEYDDWLNVLACAKSVRALHSACQRQRRTTEAAA